MKDQKNTIKVGFTTGDMNGIGPEILLKSLRNNELLSICTPVIYGPLKNLNHTLTHPPEISFGSLNKEMGAAAFESIRIGVKDLKNSKIDVLVTLPICKEAIHSKEFQFMGHTDYINSEINGSSTMMMVSNDLRVALLTEHIPISEVTDSITVDLVIDKVQALNETLMKDF